MTKRIRSMVLALGLAAWSAAAVAGEVNGSTKNAKEDYSKGISFCKFSGLNDDPTGTEGQGPGGQVQNWGHMQQIFDLDPQTDGPGVGCNPNSNPLPPELLNR